MEKITVQNTSVMIISINKNDYISLTDIAKYKSDDPTAVIGNWMRNRNTIEYLGIWESLYNPNFKPLEFEGFKKEAGLNAFTLSPQKWINTTAAIDVGVDTRYQTLSAGFLVSGSPVDLSGEEKISDLFGLQIVS